MCPLGCIVEYDYSVFVSLEEIKNRPISTTPIAYEY